MFHTIVVATDGSKPAEKAIRLASELAVANGAKLILAHVVDASRERQENLRRFAESENLLSTQAFPHAKDAALLTPDHVPMRPVHRGGKHIDVAAAEKSAGQHLLQQAIEIAGAEGARRVDAVLVRGDAADEILRLAAHNNADTVVPGSRGLGAVESLIMGSVSSKVASRAEGTCITVN